jgi:hypothetical protein
VASPARPFGARDAVLRHRRGYRAAWLRNGDHEAVMGMGTPSGAHGESRAHGWQGIELVQRAERGSSRRRCT